MLEGNFYSYPHGWSYISVTHKLELSGRREPQWRTSSLKDPPVRLSLN